jgi:hypothetical protein
VTRARIAKVSSSAAAAAILLAGCSQHPGSAAVVGNDAISTQRVDEVAQALCSSQAGNAQAQGRELASRGARQGALQVLLDSDISRQFGESKGVQPNQGQVSAALASNADQIDALPPAQRDAFREALKDYVEGRLMLLEVGRQYLASKGRANADESQAVAVGQKLRGDFAKKLNIQVDPRYGTFDQAKGSFTPTSGSLSVPASQGATDGSSPDPSAGWVASLPATQRCS